MNKILSLGLIVGMSTVLMAEPNISNADMKAKIGEIAGEKGIFAQNEVFPKDYFLIGKNLPFSIGLTLHHPRSSELNLSKEQLDKLTTIKANTMPIVIKSAKEIKALELALVDKLLKGANPKDLEADVDNIAKLKVELTKKHIICIASVRDIITKEQAKIVKGYLTKKTNIVK